MNAVKARLIIVDVIILALLVVFTIFLIRHATNPIAGLTKIITKITDGDFSQEAARAGEAGKGFAVVATEIGNLANMSSEATMQITDLIQKISQQVKLSIERTEATVSDIQESNVQVEETNKNFREISGLVSKTMVSIDTVTSKINALDNVATSMAAVTQEQSASTEEMLATAEDLYEQSAAVAERCSNVMDTAHHLNDYAEQMNEKMQQFHL